jgi:hypothetical protein
MKKYCIKRNMTRNILLKYFDTVYSLESFLKQVNLKLENESDKESIKKTLQGLSHVVIAFNFKLNGPFLSYVDKRYSYEQLLYLCYLKVNESNLPIHQNHMFKSTPNPRLQYVKKDNNLNCLNLTAVQLEKKLLSLENISISYFLSKSSDGFYWRALFQLIGGSIMKYLLMYSFMFRRLQHSTNNYVQICGCKLNYIYRDMVAQKLNQDEKSIQESINSKVRTHHRDEVVNTKNENNFQKTSIKSLKQIFEQRDQELQVEVLKIKTAEWQLKQIGNHLVNKMSMLYSQQMQFKIAPKYIFSSSSYEANFATAHRLVNEHILRRLNFELYSSPTGQSDINEMRQLLSNNILNFMELHRRCPYLVFLNYFSKRKASASAKNSKKRHREEEKEANIEDPSNVKPVDKKNVYKYLRRFMMFTLDYKSKAISSCQLIGGTKNFENFLRKFKNILNSLKYDTFTLNPFLQSIRFSTIAYLKPVKCAKYQRLILLSVVRWLIEDYAFNVLRASFYITDTGNTNYEIIYFLKSDWKTIVNKHLEDENTYKKKFNLEKIKRTDAISYCSRFESSGVHLARLLPKNAANDCRIISGSHVLNPCTGRVFNANFRMITLNCCLNWLIRNDRSLLGFGCLSHKDIHKKYAKFLRLNSLSRSCQIPLKKWHFMKFDLEKCYDSIDTTEMMKRIKELFGIYLGIDYVFTVLRCAKICFDADNKQLKVEYKYVPVRHLSHEKGFYNGIADFIDLLENFYDNKRMEDLIYVPLVIHDQNITAKKLDDSLKKCLQHVLIKIHDKMFERMNGVLHGSVCSRNLCDLYLGQIERELFYYGNINQQKVKQVTQEDVENRFRLVKGNDLILRVVDDYLVISSESNKLAQIRDVIKTRLKFNDKKTLIFEWQPLNPKKREMSNFEKMQDEMEVDLNEKLRTRTHIDLIDHFTNKFFAWYGYNFDVNTLDIYYNYEKYFNSADLRKRLNVAHGSKLPFLSTNLKMLRLFKYNVLIVLIDAKVNSIQAILRNFVDFFALSAIRFMVLLDATPNQLQKKAQLQFKIILNLCHWLNFKLDKNLCVFLHKLFFSTFLLIKYICLTVYSKLIKTSKSTTKRSKLLKIIASSSDKINFVACFKYNQEFYMTQLHQIIDQQLEKFLTCKF